MRPRPREILLRAVLVAASVLTSVLAAEVGLRLLPSPEPESGVQSVDYNKAITVRAHPLHPGDLPDSLASVLYRYRSGARWGHVYPTDPRGTLLPGNLMVYQMNAQGYRDEDFTEARTPGRARLAVIGDSFVLGEGVAAENVFPAVLEHLLQGEHPGAEVYNFGVNGYCTEDELVILRDTVMAYRPDLVVLGYTLNDADHEAGDSFISKTVPAERKKWQPCWESRSRLVSFVARRIWRRRLSSMTVEATKAPYEDAAVWEYNKRLLLGIRDIASQGGARLLVVVFPDLQALAGRNYPFEGIHRQLREFFDQAGIPHVDMKEIYRKGRPEDLFVHPVDAHPNEEGHRLAAETVLGAVAERHLLP